MLSRAPTSCKLSSPLTLAIILVLPDFHGDVSVEYEFVAISYHLVHLLDASEFFRVDKVRSVRYHSASLCVHNY